MEQSPVAFLNQENTDSKLLVIIKNADICGKIHTVSKHTHTHLVFGGEITFVESILSVVDDAKMILIEVFFLIN